MGLFLYKTLEIIKNYGNMNPVKMCENCTIKITSTSFEASIETEIEELKPFFNYIEENPDTSVKMFLALSDNVKVLAFRLISAQEIFPLIFSYNELLTKENFESFLDSMEIIPIKAKIHFANDGTKWLVFTKNV